MTWWSARWDAGGPATSPRSPRRPSRAAGRRPARAGGRSSRSTRSPAEERVLFYLAQPDRGRAGPPARCLAQHGEDAAEGRLPQARGQLPRGRHRAPAPSACAGAQPLQEALAGDDAATCTAHRLSRTCRPRLLPHDHRGRGAGSTTSAAMMTSVAQRPPTSPSSRRSRASQVAAGPSRASSSNRETSPFPSLVTNTTSSSRMASASIRSARAGLTSPSKRLPGNSTTTYSTRPIARAAAASWEKMALSVAGPGDRHHAPGRSPPGGGERQCPQQEGDEQRVDHGLNRVFSPISTRSPPSTTTATVAETSSHTTSPVGQPSGPARPDQPRRTSRTTATTPREHEGAQPASVSETVTGMG